MADEKSYQELFAKLQAEIDEYDRELKAVKKFHATVKKNQESGLFDDQDIKWIDADIEDMEEKRRVRVEEYNRRKDLYENSIVKMEKILEQRKNIIEEVDSESNVFQNRPELLKKFAEKRATLIKTVKQAKVELQQPLKIWVNK